MPAGPPSGMAGRDLAGQVDAGDLESIEEETGAPGVDFVGGDATEDFTDGGLDGRAVFGVGQVEGGAAAAALARVGDRAAGGVVVVTELFLAEAWAGAAASVGEDVAALVLLGLFGCRRCGVLHGLVPYPVKCVQSLQKKRPASGLPGAGLRFGMNQSGVNRTCVVPLFKDSKLEVTDRSRVGCCLVRGWVVLGLDTWKCCFF